MEIKYKKEEEPSIKFEEEEEKVAKRIPWVWSLKTLTMVVFFPSSSNTHLKLDYKFEIPSYDHK